MLKANFTFKLKLKRLYGQVATCPYKFNMDIPIKMVAQQVVDDFQLEVPTPPQSEEALLDLLGDVVAHLIEKRLEYFMQILYTMDVDEDAMRYAFSDEHNEPVNMVLARVILDREKRKAETRLKYKPKTPRDWAEDF